MDGSRLVSTPSPRPTLPPPPNFRPLIYLAFLFIAAACVWYFHPQLIRIYQSTNLQLTNTSPTPAPAWMTYTNKDFSFAYPGSWGLPSKTPTGCGSIESIVDPEEQYEITVTTRCNYNNATGKSYSSIEDYLHESPSKISYITIDSVKIAKITSYLASSKSTTEITFFTPSKAIYSVSLGAFTFSPQPSPIPDSVLQIFTKILSTLKFSTGI